MLTGAWVLMDYDVFFGSGLVFADRRMGFRKIENAAHSHSMVLRDETQKHMQISMSVLKTHANNTKCEQYK